MKTITLTDGSQVTFNDGVHSSADFAAAFCAPLFESGLLKQHPGADFYAICYGELCALNLTLDKHGHHTLAAVHSEGFPDTQGDTGRKPMQRWHADIGEGGWSTGV